MTHHGFWRIAAILVTFAGMLCACTGALREGGPDKLSDTRSIGTIIHEAGGNPTHIIFVHGMRATRPGASSKFRDRICEYLDGGCRFVEAVPRVRFNVGPFPKDAKVNGVTIWKNADEWLASRPFVDRSILHRTNGGQIVVDEVNWWPLLFPLKCRALLAADANITGPDEEDLKLCALTADPYHPWLSAKEARAIHNAPKISGGGAHFNRLIKQGIIDWGLTDAVIAVGPMRSYIHAAMNSAFNYANDAHGQGESTETFVVVSESLGSFAVLDTFQMSSKSKTSSSLPEATAVRDVLNRSSYLYFFANQIAILDFARIENLKPSLEVSGFNPVPDASLPSPYESLRSWGSRDRLDPQLLEESTSHVKQIVSFSDPSDLLTFYVPEIKGTTDQIRVVNLYDYNGFTWFGLFENPMSAHTGHSGNEKVLKQIFSRNKQK